MAARLAPDNVRRMHQSLHHLVADAPWNDEEMLAEVRRSVLPTMQKHGEVVAWIVDDTGFPKQGKHSVGVARQYCGQVGKQDNCQVAVSLSASTWNASLPIAWRLYLPEVRCQDDKRCQQAGRSSCEQRRLCSWPMQVLGFPSLTELGLHYIGGIETTMSFGVTCPRSRLPGTQSHSGCASSSRLRIWLF